MLFSAFVCFAGMIKLFNYVLSATWPNSANKSRAKTWLPAADRPKMAKLS